MESLKNSCKELFTIFLKDFLSIYLFFTEQF